MREERKLSGDAFALLLRVIEHPSMTIGTEPLFSDFPRLATELIDAGWLVPAGNDTAPVCPMTMITHFTNCSGTPAGSSINISRQPRVGCMWLRILRSVMCWMRTGFLDSFSTGWIFRKARD